MEMLKSEPIPRVEKLSGDIPGLKHEKQNAVERRLEDLGYK